MKSKIVINIFITYLIILIIVLISQIKTKDIIANEPLSTDITVEDKIKNSTILLVDSPFYIMNEKQSIIDSDLTITPVIYDIKVYIPVRFIANAYNATLDFFKNTKEVTVRLNNKAVIFYYNENKIKVVDNLNEEVKEIESSPIFINDRMYIPLKLFGQVFEKEVFYYNNLIVISNIDDIFDPLEDIDFLENLAKQVKNLPVIGSEDKLIEILNSKNFFFPEYEEHKNIVDSLYNTENNSEDTKIVTINEKEINLEEFFVKEIEGISFYLLENNLYIYENDNLIYEIEVSNILEDIYVYSENLILICSEPNSEYFYVNIYSNEGNVLKKISGNFEKVLFNKNSLSIISTQNVKDSEGKYSTPKKASYNDIIYFPELNNDFYTIVTNLSLINEDYEFQKVFFGAGRNIFYNNNYLYFVTEKEDFSFIHAFKIDDENLEYISRAYVKGKIISFDFDNYEYIIKVKFDDEEIIYDYELNKIL